MFAGDIIAALITTRTPGAYRASSREDDPVGRADPFELWGRGLSRRRQSAIDIVVLVYTVAVNPELFGT